MIVKTISLTNDTAPTTLSERDKAIKSLFFGHIPYFFGELLNHSAFILLKQ